ncbi:hypothetical protein GCM10027044_02940 [Hymenobacter ruber]
MLLNGFAGRAQLLNGYQFQAQAGAYVPLGAGAQRVTALETDEALVRSIPLGFIFASSGYYFTSVDLSSNGWLAFGVYTNYNADPVSFPYLHATGLWTVAPLWANLSGQGGTASYQTTGVAPNRVFVFEWRDWRWDRLASQAVVSFQVRLYEGSNRIEFAYDAGPGTISQASNDARAVIGLLGMANTAGTRILLSDAGSAPTLNAPTQAPILARPATGQLYSFTPTPNTLPLCPVPVTPRLGILRRDNARINTSSSSGGIYRVHYGPRGFVLGSADDQVAPVAAVDTAHLSNLIPGIEYEVLTELECGPGAGPSRSGRLLFRSVPVPSNDEGSSARWLPVLTNLNVLNLAYGSTQYATASSRTPLAACGTAPTSPVGGLRDVWYAFRATLSSHAIGFYQATAPCVVEVRNGVGPASSVLSCWRPAPSGDNDTIRLTNLTVGQAYFIRVYPTTAFSNIAYEDFRVGVTGALPARPGNDNCAQAITLPVSAAPGTATAGTLAAATASLVNALNATGSCTGSPLASRDVWYRFVSPGPAVVVRFEPGFEGGVEWLSTCGSQPPYPAQCVQVQAGRTGRLALTGLTAGSTYVLRVYRYSEYVLYDDLRFRLTITTPEVAPPNDDCTQATVLPVTPVGQVGVSGTLAGATSSGIAPGTGCTWLNGTNPPAPAAPTTAQDVWYRFTATAAQHVLTLSAGTDALLEVLAGGSGGLAPCAAGAGAPVRLGCTFANGADWANPTQRLPGRVLLSNLVVGLQYWVRVYGAYGSTPALPTGQPDFDLSLHTWTAPANDNPAQAQPLVMSPTAEPCTTGTVYTLDGATPSLPAASGFPATRDVWFSFVAPPAIAPSPYASAVVRFNFSQPLLDGSIELRDGTASTATVLNSVGTSAGIRSTGYYGVASATLVPGQTYYVRCTTTLVTPEPSSQFSLCLSPRISNDEPCGALPLPLSPLSGQCQGSVRGTTYWASTSTTNTGLLLPISNCNSGDTRPLDVWYRVVPTGAAFTLRCDDSTLDLARLYRPVSAAGCSGALQLVSCQGSQVKAGSPTLPLGTVLFDNLVPGQPYYLAVSTRTYNLVPTAEFTLCAQEALALLTRPVLASASASVLWPNPVPTGQVLSVQLPTTAPATAILAQWLTVLGQPVPGRSARAIAPEADGTVRLSTTGCAPGFYLLRFWGVDGRPLFTRRVVVE